MENLEQMVPAIVRAPIGISYDEKKLLNSYMNVDPASVYECDTCNNCGSGNCGDCCGSADD